MGSLSPYHWLLVLLVVLLFFGGRKIPEFMRGLGEGIHAFRRGLRGDQKDVNTVDPSRRKN